MYKNFNLTESEKEQILNRLKENGYKKGKTPNNKDAKEILVETYRSLINEQKTQTSQVAPTNALAIAKEVLQNIIAGKHLFTLKTLPGYVGAYITNEPGIPYEQEETSYGQIRRMVKINVFKVGSGVVNIILKTLSIGDTSISQWEAKDEAAANLTMTKCPDASSYLQYLNTTPPNGKLSKLNMTIENSPFPDFELWRLTHYCVSAGVSVKEMLDVLKQFNPNIGKDIIDNWFYNNAFYNTSKGWDDYDRKIYDQVKALVNQPEAPQGQQPTVPQGQKPTAPQGQKPTAPQGQKPINEQNAPVKPAVAPKQKSINNVDNSGRSLVGKPDPKLIQTINMMIEFLQVYLSGVETYVSKTYRNYGVFVNNKHMEDYGFQDVRNPMSFSFAFLKNDANECVFNTLYFQIDNSTYHVQPDGSDSIVKQLLDSKSLSDLYQNLIKYKPEVYASQEIQPTIKELKIKVTYSDSPNKIPLYFGITYLNDKQNGVKNCESLDPNYRENAMNSMEYEKLQQLDGTQKNNPKGVTQRDLDYWRNEEKFYKELLNVEPKLNHVPAQSSSTSTPQQPQPTAKKGLNEGQKILIDIFKQLT